MVNNSLGLSTDYLNYVCLLELNNKKEKSFCPSAIHPDTIEMDAFIKRIIYQSWLYWFYLNFNEMWRLNKPYLCAKSQVNKNVKVLRFVKVKVLRFWKLDWGGGPK